MRWMPPAVPQLEPEPELPVAAAVELRGFLDEIPPTEEESAIVRMCREAAAAANTAVEVLHATDAGAKADAAAAEAAMSQEQTRREAATQHAAQSAPGAVAELKASTDADAVEVLRREGVVRLRRVLPERECDRLLASINQTLDEAIEASTTDPDAGSSSPPFA